MTYAQLAKKLSAMDIREAERNLSDKISRGGGLQCGILASMSDGDRGERSSLKLIGWGLVASVGILAGVAGLIFGNLKQAEYYREAASRQSYYASNTYAPARNACIVLAIQDQAGCIAKAGNESRQNERDEQDLVAQRITAIWTYIMGTAAVVGMILSAIGVVLVYTTFRATRDGVESAKASADAALNQAKADAAANLVEAKKSAEAAIKGGEAAVAAAEAARDQISTDRAWMIELESKDTPLFNSTLNGNIINNGISILILWSNMGRSPARNLRFWTEYKFIDIEDNIPQFSSPENWELKHGMTAGPNQIVGGKEIILGDDDFAKLMERPRTKKMIIYQKLRYFDIFSDVPRISEYCAEFSFFGRIKDRATGDAVLSFRMKPRGPQNWVT